MRIEERIEYRNVNDLTPHPKNHEYNSDHDEGEYIRIKTAIEQDGIQEPIWISEDDMIVSGHTRWRIAKEISLEDIPVRVVREATEDDLLYLLVSANENRRGDEKDLMKKAKKLKILHERWLSQKGESQSGTLKDQNDIIKIAGSKSAFYRYLKLNDLIPELQEMVSNGVVGLQAGDELADLDAEEQRAVYQAIHSSGLEKVRVDEIKAICEQRDKPDRQPLVEYTGTIEDMIPVIEDDSEEKNEPEERRLQTVEAISHVLSEQEANRVKQSILLRRSKNFLRKSELFSCELKTVSKIDQNDEEIISTLNQIVMNIRELERKISSLLKVEENEIR